MLIIMDQEKITRNRDNRRGGVPLLQWEAVCRGEIPSSNIVFHDPDRFALEVLPEYGFPSTSFRSFIRKMYQWGFRRAMLNHLPPATAKVTAFCCDLFQQGNFGLLKQMRSTDNRPKKDRVPSSQRASIEPCTKVSAMAPSGSALKTRLIRDALQEQSPKRLKTSTGAHTSRCGTLPYPQTDSSEPDIGLGGRVANVHHLIGPPDTQGSIELAVSLDRSDGASSPPTLGLQPASSPPHLVDCNRSLELKCRSLLHRQRLEEAFLRATVQQLQAEIMLGTGNCLDRAPTSMLTTPWGPCDPSLLILYPGVTTANHHLTTPASLCHSLQTSSGNASAQFSAASRATRTRRTKQH
jgi:HSF-type DNA-binding